MARRASRGVKSTELYWSSLYRGSSSRLKAKNSLNALLESYYAFDLRRCIAAVADLTPGQRLLEVGCAPGGFLLFFHRRFGVKVDGMDYSREGCRQTRATLAQSRIKGKIVHADFFNPEYQRRNAGRYDAVFSAGFIEHFDDIRPAVAGHFRLAKRGGFVLCTVPNLRGVNKLLTPRAILSIHNLDVMSPDVLRREFSRHGDVLWVGHSGGFFNLGAFTYRSMLLELPRFGLYLLQRLTTDPLGKLLALVGFRPSWRYSSPSILIIARKK